METQSGEEIACCRLSKKQRFVFLHVVVSSQLLSSAAATSDETAFLKMQSFCLVARETFGREMKFKLALKRFQAGSDG